MKTMLLALLAALPACLAATLPAAADDAWRSIGAVDIVHDRRNDACLVRSTNAEGVSLLFGRSGPAAHEHFLILYEPTEEHRHTLGVTHGISIFFPGIGDVTFPVTGLVPSHRDGSRFWRYNGSFRGASDDVLTQIMGAFAELAGVSLRRVENREVVRDHGTFALTGSSHALDALDACWQAHRAHIPCFNAAGNFTTMVLGDRCPEGFQRISD